MKRFMKLSVGLQSAKGWIEWLQKSGKKFVWSTDPTGSAKSDYS